MLKLLFQTALSGSSMYLAPFTHKVFFNKHVDTFLFLYIYPQLNFNLHISDQQKMDFKHYVAAIKQANIQNIQKYLLLLKAASAIKQMS